jgi:hypothetical protein
MQPDIDALTARSQRYWNADGLPELIMGVLWMVWGSAWLFGQSLPHDWRWNAYWSATPVFLAGSASLAVWAIKRLKARFTFPRAGYVEWNEPTRSARLAAAAVAAVSAAVLVIAVRNDGSRGTFAAPILGVILSLAFVVASLRQRAPHFLALAAVALALGVALGAIEESWSSANWLFVGLGAAAAVLGAVRFTRFLKQHPRPTPEQP